MLARYCLKMPERCLLRGSAMIPSTRNLRGVCTQPLERSRPRSVVYVLPRFEYDLTVEDTGTLPKQSLVSMSQPGGRCGRTKLVKTGQNGQNSLVREITATLQSKLPRPFPVGAYSANLAMLSAMYESSG